MNAFRATCGAVALSLLGIAAISAIGFGPKDGPNGVFAAVNQQRELSAAFDGFNAKEVKKTAKSEAERVAGAAWLACTRSKAKVVGDVTIVTVPTLAALDACELQAVGLAASRGHSATDASQFIQGVRAVIEDHRRKATGSYEYDN